MDDDELWDRYGKVCAGMDRALVNADWGKFDVLRKERQELRHLLLLG